MIRNTGFPKSTLKVVKTKIHLFDWQNTIVAKTMMAHSKGKKVQSQAAPLAIRTTFLYDILTRPFSAGYF